MICVLAGGVGAARFLTGLVEVVDPDEITIIGNVADDVVLHGLHISPDLDTVTYTLAGAVDPATGWGVRNDTTAVLDALGRFGIEPWFKLGDRDLATHLFRTERLAAGAPLSEVTSEIAIAWGIEATLIPVTDDPLQTRVNLLDGDEVAFQDYFVRRRHSDPVSHVWFAGADTSTPAPGVIEAIEDAEAIIVAPSNPLVSIDPILAVPGVRDALKSRRAETVAISPIVGGKALKGPADRLMRELGEEASALGVANHHREIASTIIVDEVDAHHCAQIEALGVRAVATDTIMRNRSVREELARTVLGSVGFAGMAT